MRTLTKDLLNFMRSSPAFYDDVIYAIMRPPQMTLKIEFVTFEEFCRAQLFIGCYSYSTILKYVMIVFRIVRHNVYGLK